MMFLWHLLQLTEEKGKYITDYNGESIPKSAMSGQWTLELTTATKEMQLPALPG